MFHMGLFLNDSPQELTTEKILAQLKKDQIGFLYSRRDIGYFTDEERKNLRLTVGLENTLNDIFKNSEGFRTCPIKAILLNIFHGKNTGFLTQFDHDVLFLHLKKDEIRNVQGNIGNLITA